MPSTKNTQGTSAIEITIDDEGNAIEYRVSKASDPALDAEAMRVIKLFEPEFSAAEKNGKKVKSKISIPVVFRLG